tara:strand:- start:1040 stop:1309 length:270 start_codon:yes stop_codon:yes gene_type:complete
MKKFLLLMPLILLIGCTGTNENEGYFGYGTWYVVCSSKKIDDVVKCVNDNLGFNDINGRTGYKAQSGLHAVETRKGTIFFQALVPDIKR